MTRSQLRTWLVVSALCIQLGSSMQAASFNYNLAGKRALLAAKRTAGVGSALTGLGAAYITFCLPCAHQAVQAKPQEACTPDELAIKSKRNVALAMLNSAMATSVFGFAAYKLFTTK
jgi:hypothetical protein